MRNISFAKTTQQIREARKWVTRRHGTWKSLEPGTVLMGVVKGMGLPKGAKVEQIRPIRVTAVRLEPLQLLDCGHAGVSTLGRSGACYGCTEAMLEGFPDLTGSGFLRRFVDGFACSRSAIVTRIEFEYADDRLLENEADLRGLTLAAGVDRP